MSSKKVKTPFRWLLILIPLLLIAIFLFTRTSSPTFAPSSSPEPNKIPVTNTLADLALPPDWSELERFQETISHQTFLHRLQTIYTKDDSWKKWISISPDQSSATIDGFTLRFAQTDQKAPGAIFNWKRKATLDPSRTKPLSGLHIALDPGHIGGEFAEIEDREFLWEDVAVREGNLTLATAKTLAPLLTELGAKVTLVREKLEPVTPKRATDFAKPVLFYRTSEIRARANLINHSIRPDLVICLHYNGTASKTPEASQNFHIILNGTYAAGELAHEDERFQMLQRLLAGTITEEIPLAREIATSFNSTLELPPYEYSEESRTSQRIGDHQNLWARNLLANRLYQCPVIFMEPYIMNSTPFIERLRENPEGIYSEYAHALTAGLTRYYSKK